MALNAWVEAAAELAKRRALVSSVVSPEGRAMRRAFNRWVEVAGEAAAARGRLRGVIHELQGTGVRRAWRRWREQVGAVRSRSTKMLRAVRTLSPQGRAKRRALNDLRRSSPGGSRFGAAWRRSRCVGCAAR